MAIFSSYCVAAGKLIKKPGSKYVADRILAWNLDAHCRKKIFYFFRIYAIYSQSFFLLVLQKSVKWAVSEYMVLDDAWFWIILDDSKRRIFANKENFGKEKDAKKEKKNIGNKTLILYFFWRKITNIMKKISNLKFFEKIVA